MVKIGDTIIVTNAKNPINRPYLNKQMKVTKVILGGLGVDVDKSPLTFWRNEFKVVKEKKYA